MTRNPPNSSDERSARSRYPGTRPFSDSADDRARFFGRAEEGEQLYLRVLSVPLLVQFGKSGLGKTSLLQAGLFPRLRQKPFLPVMVRLNVADDTFTFAVAGSIQQACKTEGLELTEDRKDGLWDLLSTTTVWRDDLLLTPVLVFDQFEEVFTLRDAAFRADLAAELGALASGIAPERLRSGRAGVPEQFAARPDVKVVISLREDYLGALQEFSAAIPSLFHERLRLELLTEKAAREGITRPAQLTAGAGEEPYWAPRFDFEPSALDSMIAYLKGSSGVIEPFQLQLLCRHAEAIAYAKGGTQNDLVQLTLADFSGSKDFTSVLKNFYRDTLLKLDSSQRKRAEELCEEGLLNVSGHRLMLEEGQILRDFRITPDTLNTLSQERLVRREYRNESFFYEISHDRLAESILQSKRFRLPKKVRRALWTAGIVAPVIVAGLLLWALSLNEARQKAEGLLSFLLGEGFLGEVRDTGRSQMLKQVDDHAPTGDLGTALNRGLALRNRGDLKRTQGFLAESVALFGQALEVIESSPDNPDRREAARTRERLGEALAEQGQITQARSHYEVAVKAWGQVVTNSSNPALTTDDCTSLADSLVSAGDLKTRMGEPTRALTDLEEARKLTAGVLFGRQTSHEACGLGADNAEPYPDAKALEVFSRAVMLRAQILNFTEDYEGAAALAREARTLRPPSISARKNALVALAYRGNGRVFATPQRALDDYRKVLAEFEELRRWDPNNRLWQRERAATQLLVSEGVVACHESKTKDCKPMPSLEEAEAISLEAIATLRALAQFDSSNVSLQTDLGWALQNHARVLAAQSRQTERLAILEESERVYSNSHPDNADAEGVAALGRLWIDESDALAALGRLPEAKETLQRSIDLFKRLIAAHENNPTYVADLSAARQREAEIRRKAGDRTGADVADREKKQLDDKYWMLIGNREEEAKKLNESYVAHVNEGAKLFARGDYTEALREFNAAESSMRKYLRLRPTGFGGYDSLRNIYDWIQSTQEKLGNTQERTAPLTASMHAAHIAALLAPKDSQTSTNTALLGARLKLGIFLHENNRLEEALAMAQEVVVVAERLVQEGKQDAGYLGSLGNANCGLGMVRRGLKKAGWEEAIRSGLIHIQKAAEIDKKTSSYPKAVGEWRKYLAEQLDADGRKAVASVERDSALKAYREAARRAPGDEEVKKAIRDLVEHGIR